MTVSSASLAAAGPLEPGNIVPFSEDDGILESTLTPMDIDTNIDATNNTGSYSDGVRPNLVGNPNSLGGSRSRAARTHEWFDTSAFAQNATWNGGSGAWSDER